MANPRARPHGNTADTEHYLPQRPPSWLQPSICTQPDFQSLNISLDLLFQVNQHLRHHPFHTEPMPSQTYFQDQRAYNLFYRMRGDLILMDRLIDNLCQARRLLQFVTTGPGLPGQYRINPTASLSSRNLAIIHDTPPGFPTTTWTFQPFTLSLTTHPTTRSRPSTLLLDRSPTTSYPSHQHQHCHSHQGTFTIPRQPPTPPWLITTSSFATTLQHRALQQHSNSRSTASAKQLANSETASLPTAAATICFSRLTDFLGERQNSATS